MWRDVRYGLRVLRRSPVFTGVVVLTLSLGIGANTAIFSMVNAVLLQPLPYPDADRLAVVWESRTDEGENYMFASPPNYADWRDRSHVFEALGAFATDDFFLTTMEGTERVAGAEVSPSLFASLGVGARLGRVLRSGEEGPGSDRVAVLGHRLWQRVYGGDPGIVGTSIRLNGGAYTVVGVMPPGFDFPPAIDLEGGVAPRQTDVWVPFLQDFGTASRQAHFLTVVGRLADGITRRGAEAELRTLAATLASEYPESNDGWTVRVVPFERVVTGEARTALILLLGAVGALLLVACVNVANLMLARAAQREREYAVRTALGAGRGRLIRRALVESQLLALAGGAGGLVLAYATLGAFVRWAPGNVPRLDQAGIDPAVLAFTAAVAVATGLIFGLAPAAGSIKGSVAGVLKEGGRSAGGGRSRVMGALVVAEVALSLVLLIGGTLLFRSFLALRGVDTGVEVQSLITLRVNLPASTYADPEQVRAAYAAMERRVAAQPAITAAGFTADVPLAADFQGTTLEFEDIPAPADRPWLSNFTEVTPGYFEAMGIPLVEGRLFDGRDVAGAEPVALVNRAVVDRFLDGRDPVGLRLVFDTLRTVVGVVGDVRLEQLDADPMPAFYLPHAQAGGGRSMSLVARYRGDAATALAAVRREIRAVDAGVPLYDIRTMEQILDGRLSQPRFSALMLLAFSILALVLAGVGLYGVVSYIVGRRTREIGIRIALGSSPAQARRLVTSQGLRLVAMGVAAGLPPAFAVGLFMRRLLFETGPADPLVYGALSGFLFLVGLAATWTPARRASRVEPMEALRYE